MPKVKAKRTLTKQSRIKKVLTGIQGLDEITEGGLPQGRPTLVCGSAGCGKTLLSMEFLVNGARDYDEPGVFIAFEEKEEELAENMESLGFNLKELEKKKKLAIDYILIERGEVEETGEYDLGGLFIRIEYAVRQVGARRIVIDSIETLFSGLQNENILRAELRRLFRWLKDKGLTAMITAEPGQGTLTRHGIEEYVADCVILLDHRVTEQTSTRRMRIIKYRGSVHGANEYPFIISEEGISVLPLTSIGRAYKVSRQHISTGVPRLDAMMDGKGYFRGSSILVTGTAGTGKSSIAMHMADATCRRGENCLYLASDASPDQIVRDAKSIGINLAKWARQGLLRFQSTRPTFSGMEAHLVYIHKTVNEFDPKVLVFDPISSMASTSSTLEVHSMLLRLIDFLKSRGITNLCTNLTTGGKFLEQPEVDISSVMDTWLLLRDVEYSGERTRMLSILKSRGMDHSNQMREFLITSKGVDLIDAYLGSGLVLTGAARTVQEMKEREEALLRAQETKRLEREIERNRKSTEAKINALRIELESREEEVKTLIQHQITNEKILTNDREIMGGMRKADSR
ncbi:MAG: circadian clock protein KaiC [Thermoleophilia bacterium]|nr:circadian clock protein KaiC [Thermoleophilia bacterium]